MDIAQHADNLLEVVCHGHVLRYQCLTWYERCKGTSCVDGKQLGDHVDRAISASKQAGGVHNCP